MGIKKLRPLITHVAPDCIEYKTLDDLKNICVGIDTFIFIYKGILGHRQYNKGTDKNNINNEIVTHLEYIFDIELKLRKHNITGLWISDGKQPCIKKDELMKRKLKKQQLQKKYEMSPNYNPDMPNCQKNFTVDKTILSNLHKMLRLMGVPYVIANGEADSLGSFLNKSKLLDALITEDWDALPFGCQNLIKNFSTKESIYTINSDQLLASLDLTYEQLIDVCILLGTDYCPKIKGLEGFDAYYIYREFKDMNKFIMHLEKLNSSKFKYNIPCDFLEKWCNAKTYYTEMIQQKNIPSKIFQKRPQKIKLIKFLCDECLFDKHKTIKKVNKLMQLYYKNN